MLYSAFIEVLREHPLEWWPIGKIYIVECQWLLFKDIFLFIFFPGTPPEILVRSEPEGKSRGGGASKAPSCGRPGEGNSQTLLWHHTVNLLVQMMRETKCTDPRAGKQARLHCLFFLFVCFLRRWRFEVDIQGLSQKHVSTVKNVHGCCSCFQRLWYFAFSETKEKKINMPLWYIYYLYWQNF